MNALTNSGKLLEIIFEELDAIFLAEDRFRMPPDTWFEEAKADKNWHVLYPLAYAWTTEHPANRFYRRPEVLDALRIIAGRLFQCRNVYLRIPYTVLRSYELLRDVPGTVDVGWKPQIQALVRSATMPLLLDRELLTRFSSPNLGYGTNHHAYVLLCLAAYVSVFRNDDDFEHMDPGGAALVDYTVSYLDRFFDYMHPDGYWVESDGPALSYNTLSAQCLYLAARMLGLLDRYLDRLKRAAWFTAVTMYPNLSMMEVMNGRSQFRKGAMRLGFTGLIPEGASLTDKVIDFLYRTRSGRTGGGVPNGLVYLLDSYREISARHDAVAPHVWVTGDRTERFSDDYAVKRRNSWIAVVSNQQFVPRPEGHWNLDYTALIGLYHDSFGTVLYGCNSKDDPLASTFHKTFDSFDGAPLPQGRLMWQYLPGRGRIDCGEDGLRVYREYRGFEGIVDVSMPDCRSAVVRLHARARRSTYPVFATLQPALKYASRFRDAHGRIHEISADPFRLTAEELGGTIVIDPEDTPNCFLDAGKSPAALYLPPGAVLIWPHAMWDPYDLVNHRFVDIDKMSVLLEIPLGPEGAVLNIEIDPPSHAAAR
ncbi:MAG: hypothetical protein JW909_06685 [Planctomycetes bacterium]|nr:hypothetical protein [Planctomycetota bacterium]